MLNIKTDSRKVKPGDTFVALRGIQSDGHDYIEKAISLGAIKIVAEEGNYSVDTLIVSDTRNYLEQVLLEQYGHIIDEMNLIGLTGTNGKTTTCYLIYQALNLLGEKTSYAGTLGFYLDKKVRELPNTTPDIIDMYEMIVESYNNGYKTMVLEASSQGLAFRRLEGLTFNQAVFTNLTEDHLDYHLTMENYALAKQELFKKLKPNGISVVNNDDPYKNYFFTENTKTFGFSNSDLTITSFDVSSGFTNIIYNDSNIIQTKLLGKFNVYNISSAIAVLLNMGYKIEEISSVTKKLSPPPGRLDNIKYKTNNIVVDYAHTPDAIINVLATIRPIAKGNIYVVFGCTGDRDRIKRPIMTKIVTDAAKHAIITNDDPHFEDTNQIVGDMLKGIDKTNYEIELDRKEAIIKGIEMLEAEDFLLILGKGHEEFMIIGHDKIPFNDFNVVISYLKTKDDFDII